MTRMFKFLSVRMDGLKLFLTVPIEGIIMFRLTLFLSGLSIADIGLDVDEARTQELFH